MQAQALADERHVLAENTFVEVVVWQVPRAVTGSSHRLKYRLALIVDGECVLRYDNEVGKGDHRHVGTTETTYAFTTYERLMTDFWTNVDTWRAQHEDRNS